MSMKATLLRCLGEMESTLAELRAAVEQWPEEVRPTDALADFEPDEGVEASDELHEVFATLRTAWGIPPDVQPELPLEEVQEAMAEGLPDNWASREVMRMRET